MQIHAYMVLLCNAICNSYNMASQEEFILITKSYVQVQFVLQLIQLITSHFQYY